MVPFEPVVTENIHEQWVRRLQAWGLQGWAAAFLEEGGATTLIAAQVLHASAPFLTALTAWRDLDRLAETLEDPAQSQALAARLRQAEDGQWT
jgi:hypothetical protein